MSDYDAEANALLVQLRDCAKKLESLVVMPEIANDAFRVFLMNNIHAGILWAQAILTGDRVTAAGVIDFLTPMNNMLILKAYFDQVDNIVSKDTVNELFKEMNIKETNNE